MTSKIYFLGTAGDPQVMGRQLRASGGIVVQVDDNQFHIDPGPGSLLFLKSLLLNPREHTAILVSHNHVNHCSDVNALISAMTHGGLDKRGVLVTNKTAIEGAENYSPSVTDFHLGCVEKSIIMQQGERLGVNDVEIRAMKAFHSEPNTLGFKLFTSKFILGYTSDTQYDDELSDQYKETDILVVNVQLPSDMKKSFNMCTQDAVKLITKVKPKLAIISHFGIKMISADPLNEAREIQKATKIQTIAAQDGMTINPASYSANLKTKTLNLY